MKAKDLRANPSQEGVLDLKQTTRFNSLIQIKNLVQEGAIMAFIDRD